MRSLDFNALYAYAMRQPLPTGMPFYYRLNSNNNFDFELAGNQANWSTDALKWLSFMSHDKRFKAKDGSKYFLHTAISGEYEIEIEGHNYKVDGMVETPNQKYFLEYFGCYFHRCNFCSIKSKEDTTERDNLKLNLLQKHGFVIMIRECQWRRLEKQVKFSIPFSKFFLQKNIQSEAILTAVYHDEWFGLLECDLTTPENVREKFRAINFGTIFERIRVSENMVNEEIRSALSSHGKKFPLPPQLSLVFEAEKYLVTSETLRLYLSIGMIVTKLHSCIEYQKSRPLEPFIAKSNFFVYSK